MKTKVNQILIAAVALAVFALIPAAIKADPVTVVGQGTVTIAQGGSSGFNASVTNGGPPTIFLNQLGITFGGPSGITFSTAPFFANTPASLGPGETTGLVNFFNIMVDASVGVGVYSGTFTVQGGPTDSDLNELGTAPFTINVVAGGGQAVPEPASMFLLVTGLGGAALAKRRAKRKGKIETSS